MKQREKLTKADETVIMDLPEVRREVLQRTSGIHAAWRRSMTRKEGTGLEKSHSRYI